MAAEAADRSSPETPHPEPLFEIFGCSLAAYSFAATILPQDVEAMRGREWHGKECSDWTFTLNQKSGPYFRGNWSNPNGQRVSDNNVTVNILNNDAEVIRGGGSNAGGCTMRGKFCVGWAEGQYWCSGKSIGNWSANIDR